MVGKGYLEVLVWQNVPKDPMLEKGTVRSKAGKGYLKVKGQQRVNNSPGFTLDMTEEQEEEPEDKLDVNWIIVALV